MSTDTGVEPIPVYLHNPEALAGHLTPTTTYAREPEDCTVTTLVLTATDPVQQLAPIDPQRCELIVIQPGDNDFVIAHSKGEAQSASNSTATLPNPSGGIIPKAFPSPVVIRTQARLMVTAQAFPTRVTVVITRYIGR